MKLLCDVCEHAVASLICFADEAALCASCDSRVHAANKLASKHQRIPLLSEPSEPVACDICQERPSFFFCIEDRALLCRECDISIHSANTLAAKHKRLLLTCLQVGDMGSSCRPSRETTSSAISLEQGDTSRTPLDSPAVAVKKLPGNQAPARAPLDSPAVIIAAAAAAKLLGNQAMANGSSDGGGMCVKSTEMSSNRALKKQAVVSPTTNGTKKDRGVESKEEVPEKGSNNSSAPAAMDAKALRSYLTSKKGVSSSSTNLSHHRKDVADNSNSCSTTTISIQRLSAGKVPFVAPVLSTLRAALTQEGASNDVSNHRNPNIDNSKDSIVEIIDNNSILSAMMDVDDCPAAVESENVSDYLVSGIPEWRLDELITDLVGVCESGSSLSPLKESNTLGFGTHEDPPWYADLDAMEDPGLSPSQEEGVALVPEMPSPPTASGLVTARGKPTCPAAEPWAFDYLFTDSHHLNEFSVVPDIDGRRSSPLPMASPTRESVRKKHKFWRDD